VHRLLFGGLGAAGGPAAGLSWEVYNEGGHGAVCAGAGSSLMIGPKDRYGNETEQLMSSPLG
jgi:hypothetical protein